MTAPNVPWVWLHVGVLRAVHEEQILEHGGPGGTRDEGLLESAVARPLHLAAYGQPDACDLAAAYGFGIARNHPFVDGNKRTAFVAVELFLALNHHELVASDTECVLAMLHLAGGDWDEPRFADWLRQHVQPSGL